MDVQAVTLTGEAVRLEAMTMEHVAELYRAGGDAELWRWIPTGMRSLEDMRGYVDLALGEQQQGTALPFVIIDQRTNQIIGSTRYANIVRAHRRLEIGWTWVTAAHQRTVANTEAKYLLLSHAFETLGANRVEFKTDALNEKSRRALLRIGAKEEGTFRRHVVCESGRVRDSVYFSIVNTEWPETKNRLLRLLGRETQ